MASGCCDRRSVQCWTIAVPGGHVYEGFLISLREDWLLSWDGCKLLIDELLKLKTDSYRAVTMRRALAVHEGTLCSM